LTNKYVGPPYCPAEMYPVTCCPLVSHGEYANGTPGTDRDVRTPDRCITLRLVTDGRTDKRTDGHTMTAYTALAHRAVKTKITKLGIEMFHRKFWKLFMLRSKAQRSRSRGKKHCRRGSGAFV